MSDRTLGLLIHYIVDQLHNVGAEVSKIRIVKLLYLIDIAYYRTHRQLLTGVRWVAYRYGPYAFEIDRAIKTLGYKLEKEEVLTPDGHSAFVYRGGGESELPRTVNTGTKMMIDEVIHRWAYESLNDLLNHVYFQTAPMEETQFREALDFERISQPTGLAGIGLEIPPKRLERYRQALATEHQRHLQRLENTRAALHAWPISGDAAYREAMARRDEQEKSGLPRQLRLKDSRST